MFDLDNFCPLWACINMTSDFCYGCEYLDIGKCNYCSESEKEEIYNILERLKIGL